MLNVGEVRLRDEWMSGSVNNAYLKALSVDSTHLLNYVTITRPSMTE